MSANQPRRFSRTTVALISLGVTLGVIAALLFFRAQDITNTSRPASADRVAVLEDGRKAAPRPSATFSVARCPPVGDIENLPRPEPGSWSIPDLDLNAQWHTDQHWTDPQLPEAPAGIRYQPSQPVDASQGSTILAGHVDYAPGVLSSQGGELSPWGHLKNVQPCQTVLVADERGAVEAFQVTEIETVPQDNLLAGSASIDSDVAQRLFRADGEHTLHLLTCSGPAIANAGGEFQFTYSHNLVVSAQPAQTH